MAAGIGWGVTGEDIEHLINGNWNVSVETNAGKLITPSPLSSHGASDHDG